jgi:hypothetical protein
MSRKAVERSLVHIVIPADVDRDERDHHQRKEADQRAVGVGQIGIGRVVIEAQCVEKQEEQHHEVEREAPTCEHDAGQRERHAAHRQAIRNGDHGAFDTEQCGHRTGQRIAVES